VSTSKSSTTTSNNKLSGAVRGTNSNGSHISQVLVLKMLEGMAKSLENRQKVIGVLTERYNAFKKAGENLQAPKNKASTGIPTMVATSRS